MNFEDLDKILCEKKEQREMSRYDIYSLILRQVNSFIHNEIDLNILDEEMQRLARCGKIKTYVIWVNANSYTLTVHTDNFEFKFPLHRDVGGM